MRIPLIDPVKAVAAQIIVFHHMMLYSSMRGPFEEAFPLITGFLADPARYAVQVFLVISGFFTMQTLSKRLRPDAQGRVHAMGTSEWIRGVWSRYTRLARPFALAMLVAVAALVWVQSISPVIELTPAEPLQLLAHLLLIHDLTGTPALSAGVWYVAIDFQLFAMSLLLLAIALRLGGGDVARTRGLLFGLLGMLTLTSLWMLNRMPELDPFGIFFFGSYGLGMLAFVAVQERREVTGLLLTVLVIVVALSMEYRERLWVTGATVLFLLVAPRVQNLPRWVNGRAGQFFQRSSYALFLIHYPLSIVLFALVERMFLLTPSENLIAAAGCWLVFVAGAWGLMRAETLVFDEALPALRTATAGAFSHTVSARNPVASA